MIQADHTWMGKAVCGFCASYMLDRAFREIRLMSDDLVSDLPVLLISNHFSWWDGFIQYRLNNEKWNRTFHVMMLEEQLVQHKILRHAGAFSIRKQSRDILDTLHYCCGLLGHRDNLVLLFPQGSIQSLYTSHFSFEKGLGYLLKHTQDDFQLVFNVNLMDYYSHRKPTLSIYWKNFGNAAGMDVYTVEAGFNAFYQACLVKQKEV